MFEFTTASRILFGDGTINELPALARHLGTRALFVVGSSRERAAAAADAVRARGVGIEWHQVHREPTLDDVQSAVELARSCHAELVVAIGGGSVIDTAKAVAAVSTNAGRLIEYLEVVGDGQPLQRPGLPCIAVPTTSGTGAEVTRNAVIDVPAHATKVSLRHEYLLPKVAIVDPRLTCSLPPSLTAMTGFDALTQVLEPFVSNRSNPMTDALAVAGLRLAAAAIARTCHDGSQIDGRRDMALVSLWGGMCLANARLGAVHGLAGPIGGMFHAPHGAVCAALLGPVMRVNVELLRKQQSLGEASSDAFLERYTAVARLLTGNPSALVEDGIDWIEQLARQVGIQSLGVLGVAPPDYGEISQRALRASSMQGNAVRLSEFDVNRILDLAL